jgi:hypothetical protein
MLTASPVRRSLDDHLADVYPDTGRNIPRGELVLDGDRRLRRGERAREHAHAPVAKPLDDRPSELVVVALERGDVPLALGDAELLVRLEQSGVADHVGEHHRNEATVERFGHGATLPRPKTAPERLRSSHGSGGVLAVLDSGETPAADCGRSALP